MFFILVAQSMMSLTLFVVRRSSSGTKRTADTSLAEWSVPGMGTEGLGAESMPLSVVVAVVGGNEPARAFRSQYPGSKMTLCNVSACWAKTLRSLENNIQASILKV